jgi:hypothetical protein
MDYIARQQRLALQKQFIGRRLEFKRNTVVGMANSARTGWERFKTGAGTLVSDGGGLAIQGANSARSLGQVPSRLARCKAAAPARCATPLEATR